MEPEPTNTTDLTTKSSVTPENSLDNSQSTRDGFVLDSLSQGHIYKSNERILVICDVCFWATTYIDKSRLPILDSRCSICQEIGLSSFPVLANESFTYDYSEKRGVELEFMNRER